MIDSVFKFLKDEINTYLLTQTGVNTVEVKPSQLVDDMGKYAFGEDQIAVSLINIEEERIFKSQQQDYSYTNGQNVVLEPELKLNLYILFAANFKQYDESLKFISHILTFFQARRTFTREKYPALDPRVLQLCQELESPSYEQLNQIWTYIGGKYLPSVIYRVRMVVLQEQTQTAIQPAITTVETEFSNQ